MIRLKKTDIPNSLRDHKEEWTNDLMEYVKKGESIPASIKNRYNQDDIREQLKKETHGKCMYCESTIGQVAFEHIEHYRPKSKYPKLTFEWTNLGLSCPKCNINKLNEFDEAYPIINPYVDNPEDYLLFLGTMVIHKPTNKRGEITETLLDLNRPELMEARKERIDAIRNLVDKYSAETNATLKALLQKEIIKEMAEDKPYSRCVKSVVDQLVL